MILSERDLLLREVREGIAACRDAIDKLCGVEFWLKSIVTSPQVKAQHGDKAILVQSQPIQQSLSLNEHTRITPQVTRKKGDLLSELANNMTEKQRKEMIERLQKSNDVS